MTRKSGPLPYDPEDEGSIIRYAARLTGRKLSDFEELTIDGTASKGYFGQLIEGYFHIENNNRPTPDFEEAGIELKTSPLRRESKHGRYVSKERLVLGIIDYDEVPKCGFDMFLGKSSHLLIVFYLWEKQKPVSDYRIVKVVNWKPSEEELRVIREDWDAIEKRVMDGEAHLLSERYTRFLAACTKGAGHGADMRTQPFSDILAKQRALSFKQSFIETIFETMPDVNESVRERMDDTEMGTLFDRRWPGGQSFEDYVLERFEKYVGKDCAVIEGMMDIDIDPRSKSYYSRLCISMMGAKGKSRVKEFAQADIQMKTVRVRQSGMPKESMSFPSFDFTEVSAQGWEDSDLNAQLDKRFFIPVFRLPADVNVPRKDLVFLGAFFWSIPEEDLEVVHKVWEDTKSKIVSGDFDHFIKLSDRRISHVRPHARNSRDTRLYKGEEHTKMCFWLNADYIGRVVSENLSPRRRRGGSRVCFQPLCSPHRPSEQRISRSEGCCSAGGPARS